MSLLYLISSLPLLSFDSLPGITPAKFVETCREQLSARDAAAAEALLYGQFPEHPFAAVWQDKETVLRNAIARARARPAGKDATRWTRPTQGCDSQIESEVTDAFLESDPLKREKDLDKISWLIADELQGSDPLALNVIFAYALKLALLIRWIGLDTERGRKTFDALTEIPMTL